ncbi:MAG: hypothetical protein ABSB75_05385 [Candidatus Limnocylindrales bacterium]
MIGYLLRRLLFGRGDSAEPDARLVAFARGLALGALAGAAIAGSRIWQRWQKD